MTVAEYCRQHQISYVTLAAQCGVTPARISQLAVGKPRYGRASWRLALALERASGGKIQRSQFFPDDPTCGVIAPPIAADLPQEHTPKRRRNVSARPSGAP